MQNLGKYLSHVIGKQYYRPENYIIIIVLENKRKLKEKSINNKKKVVEALRSGHCL